MHEARRLLAGALPRHLSRWWLRRGIWYLAALLALGLIRGALLPGELYELAEAVDTAQRLLVVLVGLLIAIEVERCWQQLMYPAPADFAWPMRFRAMLFSQLPLAAMLLLLGSLNIVMDSRANLQIVTYSYPVNFGFILLAKTVTELATWMDMAALLAWLLAFYVASGHWDISVRILGALAAASGLHFLLRLLVDSNITPGFLVNDWPVIEVTAWWMIGAALLLGLLYSLASAPLQRGAPLAYAFSYLILIVACLELTSVFLESDILRTGAQLLGAPVIAMTSIPNPAVNFSELLSSQALWNLRGPLVTLGLLFQPLPVVLLALGLHRYLGYLERVADERTSVPVA